MEKTSTFNSFDLLNEGPEPRITLAIQQRLFSSYAFIEEVLDDGLVLLKGAIEPQGEPDLYIAKYLQNSSQELSVRREPTVGDKVLVIGLDHMALQMFSEEDPLLVYAKSGYNRQSAIALPVGLYNEEAKIKIVLEEGNAEIELEKDLELDAENINLNSGSKGAARDGDEITLDQGLIDWLNQCALAGPSTQGPGPYPGTFTGKITSGSDSVKIGD